MTDPYSREEQAEHYRTAARDRGCTCPDLPPPIHLVDCPLFAVPGGTPRTFHEHPDDRAVSAGTDTVLRVTYERDPSAPPNVWPPEDSPAADVDSPPLRADGASPVSSTSEGETEPREGQSAEDDAVEPSLGAGDMAEVDVTLKNPRVNFVAVVDENGVPIATWEREEDHAEERHSEGRP